MSDALDAEVAGIVLAAGLGRRMSGHRGQQLNKLLCRIDGEPMLRRTCRTVLSVPLTPVIVVLGYQAAALERALRELPVECARNPDYAGGQAGSIRTGLEALQQRSPEAPAALFIPADQPALDRGTLTRLVERFTEREEREPIVVPRYGSRRGAPVLFPRRLFPALHALRGDEGGRQILRDAGDAIEFVELDSELPLLDADTPDELVAICDRMGTEAELTEVQP